MSGYIYIDNIVGDFSLMDVIKGTGPFYISNKYFQAKGTEPCDEKTYLKAKPSKTGTGTNSGVYYYSPKLYIKNSKGDFILANSICLTPNKQTKVSYTIFKPYDTTTIKSNMVIRVGLPKESWLDKLMLIDQRLIMCLEVLLVANLLKIDLKNYADYIDTTEFFEEFNTAVSEASIALKPGKRGITYADSYINCWNSLPIYVKAGEKTIAISQNDFNNNIDDVEEQPDIYQIKNVFSQLLTRTTMAGFNTVNSMFKPMLIKRAYRNKENTIVLNNETNLRFHIKLENSRVPDSIITKKLTSSKGNINTIMITDKNIYSLWGGAEARSASYTGFIVINLNYDLSVYKMGSTYVKWDVKFYTGRVSTESSSTIVKEDLPEIEDEDDNQDEELAQPIKSGGCIDMDDED